MEVDEATFSQEEIRVLIKFLWFQKKSAKVILEEINETLGEGTIGKTSIYKWIERFKKGNFSVKDEERHGRPTLGIRKDVEKLLENDPFLSARSIATELQVDKNTVIKTLKEEMDMRKVCFHWIPKDLNEAQKLKRVECAKQMLEALKGARYVSTIYTGDESFLYWKNPRNSMWLQSGVLPPSKERKTIGSKKLMISVIWSSSGMKSVSMLERGKSFDKKYFKEKVLGDLLKKIKEDRPVKQTKELKLHIDNARPHLVDDFLAENGLERLVHPPYSPDLSPSDFFLFGYLKMKLEGKNFSSDEELFLEAKRILFDIPKQMLIDVYSEWEMRLERCIEISGNFVE